MIELIKALFTPRSEIKESPMKGEKAWYDNTIFASSLGFEDYNPDKLLQRKGNKIYDKMLLDPQIKSAYNLIVSTIVAREYSFDLPEETPQQEEIREFFNYNLEHIKGTFKSVLRNVLTAKANGFSISEKVWDTGSFDGAEKWLIKDVKLRPFETFLIKSDKHGNIREYIQHTNAGKKKIKPEKIIHFINQKDINEIWGVSDLMSCYRAYWEKDNIQKFWNIYLEKYAGGFIVAKPNNSAVADPGDKNSFEKSIKNISAATAIRLPNGYDLDVHSLSSTDAFQKAIEYRDSQIARALLIPNLMGFSPQGNTGSMAQAQVQVELFLNMINEQADLLADALNEQLFCQLAFYNYPVDDFPKLKFEPMTTEQKKEAVLSWNESIKAGAVTNTEEDQLKTRELLGYPTNVELEEPVEEPAPEAPVEEAPVPVENAEVKEFAENSVDFEELEALLDKNEENMALSMFRVTRRIERQLYKDVGKTVTSIKNSGKVKDLDKVSIPNALKSDLNRAIKESLKDTYEDGRKTAQEELRKAASNLPEEQRKKIKFTIATAKRFAAHFDIDNPEREFIVSEFVDGLTLQEINRILSAKAFYITGVLDKDILAAAEQAIINGIENNLSIKDIRVNLAEALEPIFGKVEFDPETGEVIKVDQPKGAPLSAKQVPNRLETIARTNVTNIFNQGRIAIGSDPDLGDFVEGYEYSAIIDKRTTPFCRAYDGFTRPKNDPIWSSITPPNHFNCRSILIFATVMDEWKSTKLPREKVKGEKKVEIVQPNNGFGTVKEKNEVK